MAQGGAKRQMVLNSINNLRNTIEKTIKNDYLKKNLNKALDLYRAAYAQKHPRK